MVFRDFAEPDFAGLEAYEKAKLGEQPPHVYRCTPAALRFFSRSGHSFMALDEGRIVGFVLGQALWQGDQVTVLLTRIQADAQEVYQGLLGAVVKSAYDAGVYEVALHLDPAHAELKSALEAHSFVLGPKILAVRVLGSRGQRGEVRGVLE
ncbi:MAG TPA: DUF1999 domain-containing protein [Meiothermus sp.]|jgi:hypothetical protein|nr:DUF1999 domain-containing protein [Meiothermus sp.]